MSLDYFRFLNRSDYVTNLDKLPYLYWLICFQFFKLKWSLHVYNFISMYNSFIFKKHS